MITVSLEKLGRIAARQLIQMTVQLPGCYVVSGVAPAIEKSDEQPSPIDPKLENGYEEGCTWGASLCISTMDLPAS